MIGLFFFFVGFVNEGGDEGFVDFDFGVVGDVDDVVVIFFVGDFVVDVVGGDDFVIGIEGF